MQLFCVWTYSLSIPLLLFFSRSAVSDSLRPHELQHAGLPCPSPSPRACSNSCPLNQGCHPTISSSVVPFSSCFQSFPASGLSVCVYVSLSLCVCVSLTVWVSDSGCVSPSASMCVSLCVCVLLAQCVPLCVSTVSLFVCLPLCLSL